jgi:hypothetical protein
VRKSLTLPGAATLAKKGLSVSPDTPQFTYHEDTKAGLFLSGLLGVPGVLGVRSLIPSVPGRSPRIDKKAVPWKLEYFIAQVLENSC